MFEIGYSSPFCKDLIVNVFCVIILFVQYFYEPYTRRKFRSLSSVREHLARESEDHYVNEKMISRDTKEDEDTVSSNSIFCNLFKYVFIIFSLSNI